MTLATIVQYAAGLCAGILGVLFSVRFSRGQRSRFRYLRKLDGKQIPLFLAFAVFTLLSVSASIFREMGAKRSAFQAAGDIGNQSASLSALQHEVVQAGSEAEKFFERGLAAASGGEAVDAISAYQQSIQAVPTMAAYLNLGIAFAAIRDSENAQHAFQSGGDLAERRGDRNYLARFLLNLGTLEIIRGRLNTAQSLLTRSKNLCDSVADLGCQADVSERLALLNDQKPDPSAARRYREQALRLLQRRVTHPVAVFSDAGDYWMMGRLSDSMDQLKEADKYYTIAASLYQLIGKRYQQALVLAQLSLLYRANYNKLAASGLATDGLTRHRKAAIDIFRKGGWLKDEGSNLAELGLDFQAIGKQPEAIDAFRASYEIARMRGDFQMQVTSLWNIRTSYEMAGDSRHSELAMIEARNLCFSRPGQCTIPLNSGR